MIKNRDRKRLIGLALFTTLLLSLLVIQFYKIQIIEGAKWSRQADRQHYFTVTEPFKRGRFVSNTAIKRAHPEIPQSFVTDIQKFHLHIDPKSIPAEHRDAISGYLMGQLDLSISEQLGFRGQFERRSRNRKLAMWLDKEMRDKIKAWWDGYARQHKIAKNALFFVNDYQRSYPFGKLLGQVLHTIQNQKEEVTKCAIPTGGLELYFNKYLQGRLGKRKLMRSPRNAFATGEIITPPVNGADVYLTVNHCLQAIVEEELEKGVRACGAKGGCAVMMNPHTGEVLAVAQYPFFHPPQYQWYFNNESMVDHTRIKAITDAQEPGSVMKPFTVAVTMQANEYLKAQGEETIFDPDGKMPTSNYKFAGRKKELRDGRFHKFLNMDMALQKSSNVYFARLYEKLVGRLGSEWCRAALTQIFSLGKKTGIELPAESSGVLPTPGKRHINGTYEWSVSTPYSLAIGHNVQVSALQLARAYSVFANGGFQVDPTLVRKIVRQNDDGTQDVFLDNTGPKTLKRVLSPGVVERIVRSMKYVTKYGGTSPRANVWGYTECGKSGTANKIINGAYSQKQYCATFAGFTPVSDPAFVLTVTMDEPEYGYVPGIGKMHHGGTCAAPVFREIARRSLEYLGIAPDDPSGYPPNDPRYVAEKADWVMETRKLKELYQSWNE